MVWCSRVVCSHCRCKLDQAGCLHMALSKQKKTRVKSHDAYQHFASLVTRETHTHRRWWASSSSSPPSNFSFSLIEFDPMALPQSASPSLSFDKSNQPISSLFDFRTYSYPHMTLLKQNQPPPLPPPTITQSTTSISRPPLRHRSSGECSSASAAAASPSLHGPRLKRLLRCYCYHCCR